MNYMTEANAIAGSLRGVRLHKQCGPSARALEVLAFMREFFVENDQLPPVAVISRHFGWAAQNSADCHIAALLRHKLVEGNAVGKLRFARKGGSA